MLLYVAGPYTADTPEGVQHNIDQARTIAAQLWAAGHAAICPHSNTAHMESLASVTYEQWLAGDLKILARCDGLVATPDWQISRGALAEVEFCKARGIPVWVWPEFPPLHPTEDKCPHQTAAFIDVIMRMYRVHLEKNRDYSPANILGAGFVGLVTRLWDKTARLMNLTGFRMEIASSKFEAPSAPRNESIDDTLIDLSVYGVIGQLLRDGKWGR